MKMERLTIVSERELKLMEQNTKLIVENERLKAENKRLKNTLRYAESDVKLKVSDVLLSTIIQNSIDILEEDNPKIQTLINKYNQNNNCAGLVSKITCYKNYLIEGVVEFKVLKLLGLENVEIENRSWEQLKYYQKKRIKNGILGKIR